MRNTEKEMTEYNFKVCKVMDTYKISMEEALALLKSYHWDLIAVINKK